MEKGEISVEVGGREKRRNKKRVRIRGVRGEMRQDTGQDRDRMESG